MVLVVVERTVGVVCRQGTCCLVGVCQRVDIAGQVVLLLYVAVEGDACLEVLGQVGRDVHVGCVAVDILCLHRTVLACVAYRGIVAGVLRTSRHVHGVRHCHGVACQQLEPVGVHRLVSLHLVEEFVVRGLCRLIAVEGAFISYERHAFREFVVHVAQVLAELYSLLRVHESDVAVGIARTACQFGLVGVAYGRRTGLTAFCSYDDNAVRCACTIECCGGSILQNVDTLDVLRVDALDGVAYIINVVGVVELVG